MWIFDIDEFDILTSKKISRHLSQDTETFSRNRTNTQTHTQTDVAECITTVH